MPKLLHEKLRKLRQENNYTQEFVAKYLNMTRQGYAHYEAGLRSPDHQTLLKLSKLYTIDISDLINRFTTPIDNTILQEDSNYQTKNPQSTFQKKVVQFTYDEKKLFNLYKQLSSSEKKELLAYLEKKVNANKPIY